MEHDHEQSPPHAVGIVNAQLLHSFGIRKQAQNRRYIFAVRIMAQCRFQTLGIRHVPVRIHHRKPVCAKRVMQKVYLPGRKGLRNVIAQGGTDYAAGVGPPQGTEHIRHSRPAGLGRLLYRIQHIVAPRLTQRKRGQTHRRQRKTDLQTEICAILCFDFIQNKTVKFGEAICCRKLFRQCGNRIKAAEGIEKIDGILDVSGISRQLRANQHPCLSGVFTNLVQFFDQNRLCYIFFHGLHLD